MIDYGKYFYLSGDSISGVKWKVNKGRSRAGDDAITAIGSGYRKGRLNQKTIYAHRIVFFLHFGYHADVVDHIDGDRLNNAQDNLRDGSIAQNLQNKVCKGYSLNKRSGKFEVSVCKGGERTFIGSFGTEAEAHRAYVSAKIRIHEFANELRYI